ncbi:DUF3526 domain-containing protein [Cytophagaceae bacterium DM2B3-1]|uniref:DUF3526 domain-containing protein n=1 Tax=Xanthocytophaga flava TaxID=3048013 RepID=A0ABT7CTW7_9BACT|nr:DUF3526 domain-containing protein [Xanthocytophaga flavus]MDJ1496074.1 DUF3526 domain-containing protein [Xanthocytophaga flavus]
MRFSVLKILSRQVYRSTIKKRSTLWLIGIFNLMLLFALVSGYQILTTQQHIVDEYSQQVRHRWEKSPDKHPHRMAHYGYVAFRQKFPLSFFDFGMDSYVGNAVFLEAHKQNTVNFSEASLSNGLLRFGEISAGLILQLLLPLVIFFWGFDLISAERENGTLRILLTQGISWPELIIGKCLGLFFVSLTIFAPVVVISLILLFGNEAISENWQALGYFAILVIAYLVYLLIVSLLAIFVSAKSNTSKSALTKLIGFWLFFTLILPKISLVAGQSLYPSPSKVEFDTAVEQELLALGDSHNPNDPHFRALKDSLLQAYGVDSTHKLPFNYGGYVMREGERLSAETYKRHQAKLVAIYQKQQNVVRLTALCNPFMAIKNLSMALSGTDYATYHDFENQAEAYRYKLAQTMNELQIKLISNTTKGPSSKPAIISRKHWAEFPDFSHQFPAFVQVFQQEGLAILSLIIWLSGLYFLVTLSSRYFKAF